MTAKSSPEKFDAIIALIGLAGIAVYLLLHFGSLFADVEYRLTLDTELRGPENRLFEKGFSISFMPDELPLIFVLTAGGIPLLFGLAANLLSRKYGTDLLAGIAIVTAVLLHEYLAGSIIVLMLSGGGVLEAYAVRRASSVLDALARRSPSIAHLKTADAVNDIAIAKVAVGDVLIVLPHEICPVDGTVVSGAGSMDESYLTGEPYIMSKTQGSKVLSGAINGEAALTIRADRLATDSRYAKIMEVMRASEQSRPQIRRMGDRIGAVYAPLAIAFALGAWWLSGDNIRFLAVLVVATPCPLLIGIPVAVIGAISLCAKREIVIKSPAILETLNACRTAIFDKTGTLTYGRPGLTKLIPSSGFTEQEVLRLVASLERYSKHPLSSAIVKAANSAGLEPLPVADIREPPGEGMKGSVAGRTVQVIGRKKLLADGLVPGSLLPPVAGGLECQVLVDGRYAATLQFRDEVRTDSSNFITHLKPRHLFERVMLVSGDRESEVRYLADLVGIEHVYFGQSPEDKLELVRKETADAKTVFLGDGINDAPALSAATIGIAFGQQSDITAESADAVIMDSSLLKVDELFHIGERMKKVALQSAVGGIALSLIAMGFAAAGYLTPVAGAVVQEVIDLLAILNSLRAAVPPETLSDYD
ncbi:MAG: heavy metal translocating P-type ATPase [Gammaproteobacteria bacterium]